MSTYAEARNASINQKVVVAKANQYHHGDLRNSLITAAFELISKSGPDDFAMIDAARIAGVSSAAPYRHFRDKEELLKAVTEYGFHELNQFMMRSKEHEAVGTVEHLLLIGELYLKFVTTRPGLFNLMWGELSATVFTKTSWRENKNTGITELERSLTLWLVNEEIIGQNPREIATLVWASALGFASMSINHQFEAPNIDASPENLLNLATRTLLEGLKVK